MSTVNSQYLHLMEEFPPKFIESRHEYDRMLTRLALYAQRESLTRAQRAHFRTLSSLVAEYERAIHPPLKGGTPLQRLKALAKETEMSASELGRLLGKRTLGSVLLRGSRELSKTHIRKLCRHFHLSADYFL